MENNPQSELELSLQQTDLPEALAEFRDDIVVLSNANQTIYVIGTAHISARSVDVVQATIEAVAPTIVAVELDEGRFQALQNPSAFANLDLVSVLREGKAWQLLARIILAQQQRKMGQKTGVKPGAELQAAVESAAACSAELALIDRDIGVTLKRTWRIAPWSEKIKWLAGSDDTAQQFGDDIDEEQLERLRKHDVLTEMFAAMGDIAPTAKAVLLDERDQYMAMKIGALQQSIIVAVVGAGHRAGIVEYLEGLKQPSTVDELDIVPPRSVLSQLMPYVLVSLILGAWAYGFMRGDYAQLRDTVAIWFGVNGICAAIGAMLCLPHPGTVVVAAIAAPFTSLNPMMGAGMVAGLAQFWFRKPSVSAAENARDDADSIKGWYRNDLLKVLLVFFGASLGSAIGTFAALPAVVKLVAP